MVSANYLIYFSEASRSQKLKAFQFDELISILNLTEQIHFDLKQKEKYEENELIILFIVEQLKIAILKTPFSSPSQGKVQMGKLKTFHYSIPSKNKL